MSEHHFLGSRKFYDERFLKDFINDGKKTMREFLEKRGNVAGEYAQGWLDCIDYVQKVVADIPRLYEEWQARNWSNSLDEQDFGKAKEEYNSL